MNEFKGKIAVVTGGTAGIGRDMVISLAEKQAEVYFCGRRADASDTLGRCDGRGHYFSCDIRDAAAARRFVESVMEKRGEIDYLINNVADDARIEFGDTEVEDFDASINHNLRPAFLVARAALPGLRSGTGRAIVNMGTTNWMLGLEPFTLYGTSKSGLLGFTRTLARELGKDNIRVNMVSPGWIMTKKQLEYHVREEDKKDLLKEQSLPFLLTEKHVTPVVLFLLSKAAAGVTGQNLVVDGGKLMN